jgi:hypothetical protein
MRAHMCACALTVLAVHERELYSKLDANGVLHRFIHSRPLMFMGGNDHTLLRTGDTRFGIPNSLGHSSEVKGRTNAESAERRKRRAQSAERIAHSA